MRFINRIKSKINRILISRYCYTRIPTNQNVVFLTFDDGPEPEITEYILNLLEQYNAKGTFFCCGSNAEKYPQLMEQIKNGGHSIGSHTYSHLKGSETKCIPYVKEVKLFLSKYDTNLHRPPYGSLTSTQILKLKGYCKLILWDVDSTDWLGEHVKDFDIKAVVNSITKGSIILFHFSKEHQYRTKHILPLVLSELSNSGYEFKPLLL
jgi:peptidoglycan/xylan/chitin deacetylase (PgdA/CDA1 family)